MEQTKGYLSLKGKIWGLNNKEPYVNEKGTMRSLSISIQSSKENSNYIQIGKFVNRPMDIKYKAEGMEKVEDIDEQTAITKFKEVFKDGDSVYVNLRVEPNAFNGKIDYILSKIYIESEPIDFNSEGFVEVNAMSQPVVIIEAPLDKSVKAGLITWDEKIVELDLVLEDEIVNEYFQENVKVGDLIPLSIFVFNKPIYSGTGEESERKTLKGIVKKSGGVKITDRQLEYQVVDVDTTNIEKRKYSRDDIRAIIESTESGKSGYKKTENKTTTTSKIEEEDMPY